MDLETLNYKFRQLWQILPENFTWNINSLRQVKESVKEMGLYWLSVQIT